MCFMLNYLLTVGGYLRMHIPNGMSLEQIYGSELSCGSGSIVMAFTRDGLKNDHPVDVGHGAAELTEPALPALANTTQQ